MLIKLEVRRFGGGYMDVRAPYLYIQLTFYNKRVILAYSEIRHMVYEKKKGVRNEVKWSVVLTRDWLW
jgi:hypothetical protein